MHYLSITYEGLRFKIRSLTTLTLLNPRLQYDHIHIWQLVPMKVHNIIGGGRKSIEINKTDFFCANPPQLRKA